MTQNQQRYPSRGKRFRWNEKTNDVTPTDLLDVWLASNYAEYFLARNVAEVLEGFRQELLSNGIRGCTIDDIQSRITGIKSNDRTLQWLQPGRYKRSRMKLLVKWLGANYSVYARASTTKVKDNLLSPVVREILGAGFTGCTARDVRAKIEELKTPPLSPYLGSFKGRLASIFRNDQRKGATRRNRRKSIRSYTDRKRPKHQNQASTSGEREGQISITRGVLEGGACVSGGHADESPVKAEPRFPDGSKQAPLVVFDQDGDHVQGPAQELTIKEIYRREALVDARLKYSESKKTLSEGEIDRLFPMPKV